MNPISQAILVGSNLVMAAAVSYYVLKPVAAQPPAPPPVAIQPTPQPNLTTTVDFQPLLKPIEVLNQSVNQLSLSLQRSNTAATQYEFLQNEVERLDKIDQALATRINLEEAKKPKMPSAETDQSIKRFKSLQDQVQQEIKRRRETITRLIEELERQLDPNAVAEKAQPKAQPKAPANSQAPVETAAAKPPVAAASPKPASVTAPSRSTPPANVPPARDKRLENE
jgi:hypothetical protein